MTRTVNPGRAKSAVRDRVWALLEYERAVSPGVHGHIPAFKGAGLAAQRLASLTSWQEATVVKSVPDKAQLPVRAQALREGKLVYMAVPRLAADKPFYLLDPAELQVPPEEAASSKTAARIARTVDVGEMRHVDLIVCGSVAVNRDGVRLGKGAGYSDIEVGLLQEAGLMGPDTVIVTTVHDLQIVDELLPETDHDFSIDIIVSPTQVIRCGPPRRPQGILWDYLTKDKIRAIPTLAAMASHRNA
ncbi:MAG TPA: 5-formyltetrahydrofolate cyclo-ligase [Acidimicrobiales bacterium]|nr:5-formyltetrahydrofolate cyclo-ligase [Acidimicrobiales bacterium]